MVSRLLVAIAMTLAIGVATAPAQQPRRGEARGRAEGRGGPDGQDGPQGRGGPRGFMMMFPLMRALDVDQDGELSAREIKKAVAALKSLDTDEDGKLSADELRPEMPGPGGPGGGGPGGPGGPAGGGPGGGGPAGPGGLGPPSPEAFVKRAMEFDADGDGKLSKEELAKMAEGFMRGPGGGGGDGADRPIRARKPPADNQ